MIRTVTTDRASTRDNLLRLLADAWPGTVTVHPTKVGITNTDGALTFLKAVQELCDDGLLSYEALVRDTQGPRAVQAMITPRGKAALNQRAVG